MTVVDWNLCLSTHRRKKAAQNVPSQDQHEFREPFERDYDRVLFSAPVRRLADKTQVFPLEPNDSVRTRLTHSHEVSALARALGNAIIRKKPAFLDGVDNAQHIPTILATVGLAHDLGNPPFGHQGEAAIQEWVRGKFAEESLFKCKFDDLSESQKNDFLYFEGNAQCFRLLTKLQIKSDGYGLDLTCATLAALLKYPVDAANRDKKSVASKKHGFFAADRGAIEEVWKHTGLGEGIRHPLAYLMEAADDIAYSVVDVEDAVKKQLISFPDIMARLRQEERDDVIARVLDKSERDFDKYRPLDLSPSELNELSTQKFRVHAISEMVRACVDAFVEHHDKIAHAELKQDLISSSRATLLCTTLKKFALAHAYRHRSVLELELQGRKVIHYLMDVFWRAIDHHGDNDPEIGYICSRISENYRRVYKEGGGLPEFYRKLLLLTDMIAGMTDGYAITLHDELRTVL